VLNLILLADARRLRHDGRREGGEDDLERR
jgi:hypothetical protein